MVSASNTTSHDVAGVCEVSDDRLCRALRNANLSGYVASPDAGVATYAEKYMAVVGNERPERSGLS